MAPIPLPFFGRTVELEALRSRCAEPGLTIVKGPPKIGKTRLLREFKDRTRKDQSQRIGWAESGEAAGDVLLRAIRDAYDHWRDEGGLASEIRTIHAQMKGRYISTAGVAFGKALGKLTGPGEDLVKTAFGALDEARRMSETGGVQLPRLTSEESRDLLAILAEGQASPVVIVLNQWEEGQDLAKDTGALQVFLANLADWPDLHVLVHLRAPRFPEDRNHGAKDRAVSLLQCPATDTLTIGLLDFEEDHTAYADLLDWLTKNFAAFAGMEGGDSLSDLALEEIAGHPAVPSEWSYAKEADRASFERLSEIAADARALHYPELRTIYDELLASAKSDRTKRSMLEVALLAAVLPQSPVEADQRAILPAVLGLLNEGDLDDLESADLLRPDRGLPLLLGHPSRRETAERIVMGGDTRHGGESDPLAAGLKPYVRRAVARVIPALVELHPPEAWSGLSQEINATTSMLAASTGLVEATGAGDLATMLCAAARCLLPGVGSVMPDGGAAVLVRQSGPSARVLVAWGLFNAFNDSEAGSDRATKMLDELRGLAEAHPEEGAVREQLAKGLNNAIGDSGSDFGRADGLLAELRELAGTHPEDGALRESFCMGLANAIADSDSDFDRADGLLKELCGLVRADPEGTLTPALSQGEREEDAAVREQLVRAYGASIRNAMAAKDAGRAAAMAEGLVPLRDAVESQPGVAGLIRKDIAAALGLAIEQDDGEAGTRLTAASRALFGE